MSSGTGSSPGRRPRWSPSRASAPTPRPLYSWPPANNPERLRSEADFAHLCGVGPITASSGKTSRHRLNRGGDRDANRALHLLAVRRMAWDPRTRAYVARRTAEGRSKPEILRCLKRYLARELYPLLAGRPPAAVLPPSSAA